MNTHDILHETARRLRVRVTSDADLVTLRAHLERLPGVRSVRFNTTLGCMVVQYDGRPEARAAVLGHLRGDVMPTRRQRARPRGNPGEALSWTPSLLAVAVAVAVPVLPQAWRRNAALAVVATRVLSQGERLRSDPPAVLLDAASLASLAISGEPLVVSASVLLRLLSERLSARLVRQADGLLDHLLPTEAVQYTALRENAYASSWSEWPLRALRAGDRIRLFPGDVVPVDGCVVGGTATLTPAAQHGAQRPVRPGDHLAAGELLHAGMLELRAEADASASRLERLRAHVRHAIDARDPQALRRTVRRMAREAARGLEHATLMAAQASEHVGDLWAEAREEARAEVDAADFERTAASTSKTSRTAAEAAAEDAIGQR